MVNKLQKTRKSPFDKLFYMLLIKAARTEMTRMLQPPRQQSSFHFPLFPPHVVHIFCTKQQLCNSQADLTKNGVPMYLAFLFIGM